MKQLLTFLFLLLGFMLPRQHAMAQTAPPNGSAFMNLPDTACWNSFASMNAFYWKANYSPDYVDWTVTGGSVTVLYSSDGTKLVGQKPDTKYGKNALTLKFNDKGLYTITAKLVRGNNSTTIKKTIYVKDCSILPCQGQSPGVGDFKETFGNFKVNAGTSRSNSNVTGYTYVAIPLGGKDFADDSYTIYYNTQIRGEWVNASDHTGSIYADSVGGMLIANSSVTKKSFYTKDNVPVCPGSQYNFSAWFMNVNSTEVFNSTCAAGNPDGYHYAGVTFLIINKNKTPWDTLARFKTYDVSMNLKNPQWQMYGGGFKTPGGVTAVTLTIVNDRLGDCGNDIAIDDITFNYCSPYIYSFIDGQYNPPLTADSLCEGAPVTIKATYSPNGWQPDGTYDASKDYFQKPIFQWEKSPDSLNWSPLYDGGGITGTSDSVLVIAEGALKGDPNQIVNYFYRVNIIEKGNSTNCATPSLAAKVTVLPKPKVKVSSGRICIGESVDLEATGGYSKYEWKVEPVVIGPKLTVYPQATTTYEAVGIADYGWNSLTNEPRQCKDSGRALVVVDSMPVAKITGGPTEICLGDQINLHLTITGAPADSITWKWAYQTDSIAGKVTDISHTPADTGRRVYYAIINNKNCNALDSFVVQVRSLPKADADTTYKQCNTTDFAIKRSTPPADQQGTWYFEGNNLGATITNINAAQTTIKGVPAGDTVHLLWVITNKYRAVCTDTSRVTLINTKPLSTSIAGPDMIQCDSTIFQLAGSKPGPNETGTWSLATGYTNADVTIDNINAWNAQATILGATRPTTVELIWTISNGVCTDDTSSIKLTVKQAPTVKITATPVCNTAGAFTVNFSNVTGTITNYTIDVASTRPMPGFTAVSQSWPGGTSGSFTVAFPASTPAGSYDFVLTANEDDLKGCSINIPFSVSVEIPSTAPTGVTASVDNFCISGNATLTVVGGSLGTDSTGKGIKWRWYTGSCGGTPAIPTSANADSSIVTFNNITATTTFFVRAEGAGACATTSCASVTVTVLPQPNTAAVGTDQTQCNNATFTLSGNNPVGTDAHGVWRWPAAYNGVITIADSTNATTTVTVAAGNTVPFTWWITNGVCDSTQATVKLTNFEQPVTATVGADQAHCNDANFTLSGNTPTEYGAHGVWRWPAAYNGVITIADSTNATTTVTVKAGNTVSFTWWITNGVCDSTKATVKITNFEQPVAATVGADQAHCNDANFTLSGNTPTEYGAHGVWRWPAAYNGVITIADSTNATTTVTVKAGNTVPFTWWITNGVCDSTQATVKITNFEQPVTATVGADQAHCNDANFTLSGNTPTEYGAHGVWRWPAAYNGVITIADSTNATTTVTVKAGNTVPFTWWITNGVCDSTKATVKITNFEQPVTATVGADQAHCNDANFTLSGNTPTEYGAHGVWRWPAAYNGVITIADSTNATTTVTVKAGNTVPFTWWITNGVCDSTQATVKLTNFEQPVTATVGADQAHCNDANFTLSGNTPTEYGAHGVWRWPAAYNGVITIADSTNATTTVTVKAGNTVPFTWWITNGVCDSTQATVKLTNFEQPVAATVGADQAHCNDANFTLSGNTTTEYGAHGVWRWPAAYNGVITIADSTNATTTVTVKAGNTVPFTWWITNGVCDSTQATVKLTNFEQPVTATVGADQAHCNDANFILSGNTPTEYGAHGVWRWPAAYNGVITIADSTNATTTVTVQAGNTVPFTWWITNGVCDSTKATVKLTNFEQPVAATVGADQAHCNDANFTLSGNTPTEYGAHGVWRWPAAYNGVITIADSTNATTTVTVQAGNTVPFTWWITNGVCDSTKATVKLTNFEQPVAATVGADQAHCNDANFTLSGNTPTEYGAHGVWRWPAAYNGVITIADSTNATTTVTVKAGNTVPFTWWITNGVCDSTQATVKITNFEQPVAATVGADQAHCNDANFTLSGNTPTEYGAHGVWRWPAAYNGVITIADSTNATTTVTVKAGNTVPFTWWITNGVCDSTQATVKLTNFEQPVTATVGADQAHCNDANFTLSGNTPTEYGAHGVWRWPAAYNGVITIADSTNATTTVTVKAGNTVPFTWWITNGVCDSTQATVKLTNFEQPVAATVGADQAHCNDANFTLSGNTPTEYGAHGVWRWPAAYNGVITIADSTNATTTVTVKAGNTVPFTWWITNGVCDSTQATVKITNFEQPVTATVGADQAHCNDANFTLSGNTPTEYGAHGVWRWPAAYNGVITIADSTNATTTVTVKAGNTVSFTWWITNGVCDSTQATVKITNFEQPVTATVGADQAHCNDANFTLSGNTPTEYGAHGVWRWPAAYNGVITIADSTNATTTVTVAAGNTVPFTWWITNGVCDSTQATVKITNFEQPVTATVGADQAHCNDANFTLSGNTPTEYGAHGVWRWPAAYNGVITIADSTNATTTVTVKAGNTVPFTWWITNGVCDSTQATVKITNFEQPVAATVGADQAHCNDANFTLSGNTPTEYGAHGVWRWPAAYNGVITIADSTNATTTVTVKAGNTVPFTWWITNGVCDSTQATVKLTNFEQPVTATVGADQAHCNDANFTLSGNTPTEYGAHGVWRWPAAYNGVITIADS
ncbi:hypothetical protein ACDQ55_16640, partial [Chitinophaga sp. 30R24]|uniref:Ig-like domain-containing protein n=1 Tax=Chitinophaga sp. 30R24 TaxID=3248838 RepID=UPI003B91120D